MLLCIKFPSIPHAFYLNHMKFSTIQHHLMQSEVINHLLECKHRMGSCLDNLWYFQHHTDIEWYLLEQIGDLTGPVYLSCFDELNSVGSRKKCHLHRKAKFSFLEKMIVLMSNSWNSYIYLQCQKQQPQGEKLLEMIFYHEVFSFRIFCELE